MTYKECVNSVGIRHRSRHSGAGGGLGLDKHRSVLNGEYHTTEYLTCQFDVMARRILC